MGAGFFLYRHGNAAQNSRLSLVTNSGATVLTRSKERGEILDCCIMSPAHLCFAFPVDEIKWTEGLETNIMQGERERQGDDLE